MTKSGNRMYWKNIILERSEVSIETRAMTRAVINNEGMSTLGESIRAQGRKFREEIITEVEERSPKRRAFIESEVSQALPSEEQIDHHIVEELHKVTAENESTLLPASSLVSILRQYSAKSTTSQFDPARSYILDLTPASKIINEFDSKQWTQLLEDKNLKASCFHHEIETIIGKLFDSAGAWRLANLMQARQRWRELSSLPAPSYSDEFSYNEDQWERILWWARCTVGQFLDAFEAYKNPLEFNCNETEWLGAYIVPLLEEALKLDGVCCVSGYFLSYLLVVVNFQNSVQS
ncbi:hypothetical protein BC938DRAFT_479552 [Jimgerdemannia flammicorona]|uniref:Uncharacterized protein n=1 Tax=Jimgerdemannia flammicorona TaxID=994334 RepID=A0A433QKM8_9FUNG|nr:hypothetical protein BC938DRAFT_479552 [Jimgerdemannia flammicorona]